MFIVGGTTTLLTHTYYKNDNAGASFWIGTIGALSSIIILYFWRSLAHRIDGAIMRVYKRLIEIECALGEAMTFTREYTQKEFKFAITNHLPCGNCIDKKLLKYNNTNFCKKYFSNKYGRGHEIWNRFAFISSVIIIGWFGTLTYGWWGVWLLVFLMIFYTMLMDIATIILN